MFPARVAFAVFIGSAMPPKIGSETVMYQPGSCAYVQQCTVVTTSITSVTY
jgi:hypothetical protein